MGSGEYKPGKEGSSGSLYFESLDGGLHILSSSNSNILSLIKKRQPSLRKKSDHLYQGKSVAHLPYLVKTNREESTTNVVSPQVSIAESWAVPG